MALKNLVLIIDDNQDFQELFGIVARLAGFEVEAVYDGKEAIQRLECEPIPTLVLLDALLPLVAGAQVLQAARSNEKWARVPIYIVTADLRVIQSAASLAPNDALADGVIEKGAQAIQKLRELFEKYREKSSGGLFLAEQSKGKSSQADPTQ